MKKNTKYLLNAAGFAFVAFFCFRWPESPRPRTPIRLRLRLVRLLQTLIKHLPINPSGKPNPALAAQQICRKNIPNWETA